jgi:DNA-directed RNA polymerase
MKYLRNIATILTLIGLPIIWTLPHGLTVRQSYLEAKSTSIRPFI